MSSDNSLEYRARLLARAKGLRLSEAIDRVRAGEDGEYRETDADTWLRGATPAQIAALTRSGPLEPVETEPIHLPSLPTVVLTVAKHTERRERMREFLGRHGWPESGVRWIYGEPTANHHAGARIMARDTLRALTLPSLWLEDDATEVPGFSATAQIPVNADAIYFGGCRAGSLHAAAEQCGLPNLRLMVPERERHQFCNRGLYAETADPRWVRIVSMYSGHAILWLTEGYRQRMLAAIAGSIPQMPYDVTMAGDQWRHRVYGLRVPWLYQRDGNNDVWTWSYCPAPR
jgi:hypothetical protein